MKQKVILIANQKGGVGKTLIADEIAFSFDRDEIVYSLYDGDQQGGLIHVPEERENAVVAIVDTPGALNAGLVDDMRAADLIIIPTRMTPRDIAPLETMLETITINQIKAKTIVVLNGWNRYRASREFYEWFSATYPRIKTVELSQSEAFTQAALNSQSVIDYNAKSKPAEQIEKLVSLVKKELKIK